jgi:hypothetical protein
MGSLHFVRDITTKKRAPNSSARKTGCAKDAISSVTRTTEITLGIEGVKMAERFRKYLDREDPPVSTIDGRTGADRLLDRLRAEYREPRVDTAPQLESTRGDTI